MGFDPALLLGLTGLAAAIFVFFSAGEPTRPGRSRSPRRSTRSAERRASSFPAVT